MLEKVIDAAGPMPPVLVQGATGHTAQRHIGRMRAQGTPIVAGVSPRGGEAEGLPIFRNCAEAVAATGATVSVLMVPPLAVLEAVQDALAGGVRLLVTVTEGIPVSDQMRIRHAVRDAGAEWVGASSPGMAVPGRCKLGFLPDVSLAPGPVAVWSKSGTLSYETGLRLKRAGLGQSAWIGVGGDPVKGMRFADLVPLFRGHAPTRAVVIVGEIGGTEEEELAEALTAAPLPQPVFALLAGSAAPEGVAMGHAGAIVEGGRGSYTSKAAALGGAGVQVFDAIAPLVAAVGAELGEGP